MGSARGSLAGRMVLRLLLTVATALVLVPGEAGASTDPWSWPLDGRQVGERFDPPADRYGPGHRGVDLRGGVGDAVHAVAAGRVTFAGQVGGVPVITIDHGQERSTYQPVAAAVQVGDAVEARERIGTLIGEHSHCAGACLHLGRLAGADYLDPLELLSAARFRLISPDGTPPGPPSTAETLTRPVGGPVTSAFGMRVHPITGVRSLHDGTDFGVPCGTPVHAASAGLVVGSGTNGAYGQQVTVSHGPGLQTSYSHLSRRGVSAGDRVGAGEVVGHVGSSGSSTGCHLHFSVNRDGELVDPMSLL